MVKKNTADTISILSNFVGPGKIIKYVASVPNFNDEPKLSQVVSVYKGSEERAGAFSLSAETAVLRAMGEGVERHCNYGFEKNDIVSNFEKIKDNALDPRLLTPFSDGQLKDQVYRNFVIKKTSVFGWVKGRCLTRRKNIFLPSQEVYLNYKFLPKEPIIRFPISTGAAGGTTVVSALVRGICEVIERGAIIISYLDKLPSRNIKIKSCPQSIQELNEKFERYFLKIRLFDVTTEIGIPTVLAAIYDTAANKICPVSFGSKCGFDAEDVIIGAIMEAQNGRVYTRELVLRNEKYPERVEEISEFKHRSMFWTHYNLVKTLNFYLKGDKINFRKFDRFRGRKMSFDAKLKFLISVLKTNGFDIYCADLTKPEVKRYGYYVIKTIIPKMHPLYFDELFPYNYSERLKTVPKIIGFKGNFNGHSHNKIPHPFL